LAGWDKEEHRITQHDDPGSHKECTKRSNLKKNPEEAAERCMPLERRQGNKSNKSSQCDWKIQ